MNSLDLPTNLSMAVSAISLLSVLYIGAVKVARMELKVDTMWEFMVKRAKGEAVVSGLAEFNSPLIFKQDPTDLCGSLAGPLRAFYATAGLQKKSDGDVMLEIERKFGDKILREVCIPNRLNMGTCLLIALHVARGDQLGSTIR